MYMTGLGFFLDKVTSRVLTPEIIDERLFRICELSLSFFVTWNGTDLLMSLAFGEVKF